MDSRKCVEEFNPFKFFVTLMTISFTLLLHLQLDNSINLSYWIIFTPLWIWKLVAFFGFVGGLYVWLKLPLECRDEGVAFLAMCGSFVCNIFLFSFELLVCLNLESMVNQSAVNVHDSIFPLNVLIVFIPLFLLCFYCIFFSIWSMKNGRNCHLEIFCCCNVVSFIFIALRLDRVISWSWRVTFIPLWIVLGVSLLTMMYGLIISLLLYRVMDMQVEQRRRTLYYTTCYAFFLIFFFIYVILLVDKLDSMRGEDDMAAKRLPFSFSNSSSRDFVGSVQAVESANLRMARYLDFDVKNDGKNITNKNGIINATAQETSSRRNGNSYIEGNVNGTSTGKMAFPSPSAALQVNAGSSGDAVSTNRSNQSNVSHHQPMSFIGIYGFLLLALLNSLWLSFFSRVQGTGNVWWFGLRHNMLRYFLHRFVGLQHYANVCFAIKHILVDPPAPNDYLFQQESVGYSNMEPGTREPLFLATIPTNDGALESVLQQQDVSISHHGSNFFRRFHLLRSARFHPIGEKRNSKTKHLETGIEFAEESHLFLIDAPD